MLRADQIKLICDLSDNLMEIFLFNNVCSVEHCWIANEILETTTAMMVALRKTGRARENPAILQAEKKSFC